METRTAWERMKRLRDLKKIVEINNKISLTHLPLHDQFSFNYDYHPIWL